MGDALPKCGLDHSSSADFGYFHLMIKEGVGMGSFKNLLHKRRNPFASDLEHFAWLLGREPLACDLDIGLVQSPGEVVEDDALVRRVMKAYDQAHNEFSPSG